MVPTTGVWFCPWYSRTLLNIPIPYQNLSAHLQEMSNFPEVLDHHGLYTKNVTELDTSVSLSLVCFYLAGAMGVSSMIPFTSLQIHAHFLKVKNRN